VCWALCASRAVWAVCSALPVRGLSVLDLVRRPRTSHRPKCHQARSPLADWNLVCAIVACWSTGYLRALLYCDLLLLQRSINQPEGSSLMASYDPCLWTVWYELYA
jgi:hypothetical protein